MPDTTVYLLQMNAAEVSILKKFAIVVGAAIEDIPPENVANWPEKPTPEEQRVLSDLLNRIAIMETTETMQ